MPQKPLAMIGEKTLAAIGIEKTQSAAAQYRQHALAAIPATDAPLIAIAERMDVETFLRDSRSSSGETAQDIYHDWTERLCERFDWVVVINPCMPFLRVATIGKAIEKATSAQRPFTAVYKRRGVLWNANKEKIVGRGTPNLKTDPIYYEACRAFFGYPIGMLGRPEAYDEMELVELPPGPEFIDIDTPEDLAFAKTYFAGKKTLENDHVFRV